MEAEHRPGAYALSAYSSLSGGGGGGGGGGDEGRGGQPPFLSMELCILLLQHNARLSPDLLIQLPILMDAHRRGPTCGCSQSL